MRLLRLFSAAVMLDPVAVAPERVETEAVYCPFDSCTLPEYCLPCTVVEKLVAACISSTALLPPPPPPPPEREVLADEVVADEAVLAESVMDDALAVVDKADGEAAVDRLTDTGFNSVAVEAVDEMLRICMALPPEVRLISLKSFFGGFGPGFRKKIPPAGNGAGAADARMQRGAERSRDDIFWIAGHGWTAIPAKRCDEVHSFTGIGGTDRADSWQIGPDPSRPLLALDHSLIFPARTTD